MAQYETAYRHHVNLRRFHPFKWRRLTKRYVHRADVVGGHVPMAFIPAEIRVFSMDCFPLR